ncbi:MAG: hypothetical protein HY271_17480 [Deltaproteobacteria bacterium]|nr:hypothetical protein [Deltaproteobacteria bacterium]
MGRRTAEEARVSRPLRFEVSSVIAAPADRVWQRVSTMAGVNAELRPIVRMTYPPEVDALRPEDVAPGVRVFRSWILLCGVLPVDYDDLTLLRVTPGRAFTSRRRWGASAAGSTSACSRTSRAVAA